MKKLFSVLLILTLVISLAVPATAEEARTAITLSHTGTITLSVGQSIQLSATVTPTAPVAWSSKKASVASVSATGKVTALTEGTTTIVAKTSGKSAKVKVKVVDPYKPSGIAFKQGKTATVNVGSTLKLETVLAPSTAKATLTWKSSKPTVAAVDASGNVTPLMEGKTKITVTTHNKKKATILVTVVDPFKPTGITLSQGKAVTLTTGQTLQLTPVLVPNTAKANLTFKSSKSKVAIVDSNGKILAVGRGKAKITVQATNNKKAKAVITITVNAGVNPSVNKDLTSYFGMVMSVAANRLCLKKTYRESGAIGCYNGSLSIIANEQGQDFNYARVDSIYVVASTGFNVAGVTYGMDATQAATTLLSAGYRYDTTYHNYRKGRISIGFATTSGKVSKIIATYNYSNYAELASLQK